MQFLIMELPDCDMFYKSSDGIRVLLDQNLAHARLLRSNRPSFLLSIAPSTFLNYVFLSGRVTPSCQQLVIQNDWSMR